MGLKEYNEKRDFRRTKEPKGDHGSGKGGKGPAFVVQKHDASSLHYDFRLEAEGVLLSWAVPKGPSLDPGQKRLAVRTEDHPLEYADFEGTIPEDEYGGGTVMVWDTGTASYEDSQAEVAAQVNDRKALSFVLDGTKLSGKWRLVPFGGKEGSAKNWLLIKSRDDAADEETDVLESEPDSAKTGRTMDEIADDQ